MGKQQISDGKYLLDKLVEQPLLDQALVSDPQNKITVLVVSDFPQLSGADAGVCCRFFQG